MDKPAALDTEMHPDGEGGYFIWAPDPTGTIIGSGESPNLARSDAIQTLAATIAELSATITREP